MKRRSSFPKPKPTGSENDIDAYFADEQDDLQDEDTRPVPDEHDAGEDQENRRMQEEVRRLRVYVAHLTEQMTSKAAPEAATSNLGRQPVYMPKLATMILGVLAVKLLSSALRR